MNEVAQVVGYIVLAAASVGGFCGAIVSVTLGRKGWFLVCLSTLSVSVGLWSVGRHMIGAFTSGWILTSLAIAGAVASLLLGGYLIPWSKKR